MTQVNFSNPLLPKPPSVAVSHGYHWKRRHRTTSPRRSHPTRPAHQDPEKWWRLLSVHSRVICWSTVELGPRGAKKGGGSGLENALVCCANVEYDSDVEDNQEIKGGGGGGGVDTESVQIRWILGNIVY